MVTDEAAQAGHVDPLRPPLADGEVRYLAWLGAGAIDEPQEQVRLLGAWGMCQRHALGFLAVEASLNEGWMFRPAVVYDHVFDRAVRALAPRRLFERSRVAAYLLDAEPCPVCDPDTSHRAQVDSVPEEVVARGRDLAPLRRLALETRPQWEPWICGPCAGNGSPLRCRLHLAAELRAPGGPALPEQRRLVALLSRHLRTYARSFGWANRGLDMPADRAALLGAVGWCAGWQSILGLVG